MTTIEKVLYTAKTHTTGGRDGASQSSDGRLEIKLSSPGAAGTGTNPEQLFAAGWSACFIGAMGVAAAKISVPVIVMTAFGTVQTAVEAMKHGAFDYITKPFNLDELMIVLEKAFAVATSSRTLRCKYSSVIKPSMIAARVAGVPRPFSCMASRNSSSSMNLPAPSIAVSSVASL